METIRIERGRIHNLPYHNARMNRTRRELFGAREEIDLAGYIHPAVEKSNFDFTTVEGSECIEKENKMLHIYSCINSNSGGWLQLGCTEGQA